MSFESACSLSNLSLPAALSNSCCSLFEGVLGATTFTEVAEVAEEGAEEVAGEGAEEGAEGSEVAEEGAEGAEEAEEAEEAAYNSLYTAVILSLNFPIFFAVHGTTLRFCGNFAFNISAAP